MPNYKLSPKVCDHMRAVAKQLVERRCAHMQTGFPLSLDKIQQAVLPAKWRSAILDMIDDGVKLIEYRSLTCWVDDTSIERAAVLDFVITPPNSVKSPCLAGAVIDVDVLTTDEIAALAKWVNGAVLERRLANLALRTINSFLDIAVTSGHVLARWPALTMLVQGDPRTICSWMSQTEVNSITGWRRKLAEPPRHLKFYAWPADLQHPERQWYERHRKAMRAAEVALTGGSMLPKDVKDDSEVKATVKSWRPLPGDLDRP